MKVVLGPFVHAMPENTARNPGPGFDGYGDMIRWFDIWLKNDTETTVTNETDITLFIRTSLRTGTYRYLSSWPIPMQQKRRYFLRKEKSLVLEHDSDDASVDTLVYRPSIGYEGGFWWGSVTGDQRNFDQHCLIYESSLVNEIFEIAGFVHVSLQVTPSS